MDSFLNVSIEPDFKWLDIIGNIGLFDIETHNFNGFMDVVKNEDNICFVRMDAPGNSEIKSKGGVNCFLIFYTSSLMSWINGSLSGSVCYGGVILIDCSLPFIIKFNDNVKYKAIVVPYCMYDINIVSHIKLRNSIYHYDVICSIFEHTNTISDDFTHEILSIVHLLPIVDETLESDLFKNVIEMLNSHALEPAFSLDKAAELLFFSKRKLHNFLVKNGTSYSKVITEYRVNYLAGKMVQQDALPLKTLCSQSGFNSVNTANVSFKRIKGMSLSAYRKSYRLDHAR